MTFRDLATLVLFIAWLPSVGFVVLYWVTAPWWRSAVGRNLMGLAAVIAVFLSLALTARVIGSDWPGYQLLALVLYGSVAVLMARRTWLLWRAQHGDTAGGDGTD